MLRAIDVQQVVIQMEHVEKVQRAGQSNPDMQQRYLELQAKEEQKLRQQNVPAAEEAGKTLIRDKREREREKRAGADLQESVRQDGQGEEAQDEAQQGGHINIKV